MKSLETRMKEYEGAYKYKLTSRSYLIIRLDGKNFSKYTKNLEKPFDVDLSDAMNQTAVAICEEFNGKFAYTQSDEISVLITDVGNLEAQPMFGGSLQKLCSLSASVATAKFNEVRNLQYANGLIKKIKGQAFGTLSKLQFPKQAFFDARVFIVPSSTEAINHMIWRQQDATRNSISMAGQANFSHKDLQGLSGDQVQEKLFSEGDINWNDYPTKFKRGICIFKEQYEKEIDVPFRVGKVGFGGYQLVTRSRMKIDMETPVFTQDRGYLQDLIPTI